MIAKLVLTVTLATFICQSSATDAECPPGAVLSPYDPNVCYLFSSNSTDYYSADDFCVSAGGHLSSVHSSFENNYFRGAASSSGADSFWIGGTNNNFNGTWKWEDGSAFDWIDWGAGQPNGTAGLCAYVKNHDGYWFADGCTLSKPFICKVNPLTQGLASCPIGWSFYSETKNCYKVLKNITNLTCDMAFQRCSSLNATVASIHSFRENSFISGMISTTTQKNFSVIGLVPDKASWRWQDNSLYNYTRWDGAGASQFNNNSCIVLAPTFYKYKQNWFSFSSYGSYATEVVCELNGYQNSLKAARESACPKGTIESPDNSNICYKIYPDASNWYAAEQSCQKGNGHLVSIHNSGENAYLLGVVPFTVHGAVDFWTGGFLNSTWKWSDNEAFDFTNWAPGNPLTDSGLCLSEKVRTGYWYSTKCDDKKPFICTVPPNNVPRPSCPPDFSYYDVTNKCYKVVQTNATIINCDNVEKICFDLTAKLASIHSDEENFFIAGLAMNDTNQAYTYTAIGLVSDGISWKWTDGTAVDYTKWYSSYAAAANGCAVMTTSFLYYDYYSTPQWVGVGSYSSAYANSYTQVICQTNAS